jgi:hypothetical protein
MLEMERDKKKTRKVTVLAKNKSRSEVVKQHYGQKKSELENKIESRRRKIE